LPHVSGPLAALKLVCVWLLVLLAGATASQLIARVARRAEPPA
jgi:multisubunit Na+/H+ antiporter MnhG subunit